jgi:esterase/lipase superfamily enzyme
LRKDMLGGRDALIFIHGFNVTFLAALTAGALLAASLPKKVKLIVFSWPSDGKKIPYMSYYSDREDARASGPALARAYLKLFDFVKEMRELEVAQAENAVAGGNQPSKVLCDRCIHILAHSMGNYVLRQGIQAIRAKEPVKMVRMFDQVIMAAPDEDDDTFECDDKLRVLPTMARRITVYHNRKDRALVISDKTKANPDRLGSEGPRMLDLLPKKVIIVDCARIAGPADPLAFHSYYIRSPSIGKDIAALLADEEDDSIDNRETIRVGRAYRILG